MMDAFADEPDSDAPRIGQITCVVIANPHRRMGVARSLLNAACQGLQAQGFTIAEASLLAPKFIVPTKTERSSVVLCNLR